MDVVVCLVPERHQCSQLAFTSDEIDKRRMCNAIVTAGADFLGRDAVARAHRCHLCGGTRATHEGRVEGGQELLEPLGAVALGVNREIDDLYLRSQRAQLAMRLREHRKSGRTNIGAMGVTKPQNYDLAAIMTESERHAVGTA